MKVLQNSLPGVVMVLLAVVGFGLDFVELLGLTGTPAKIAEGVLMILTLMGVRDIMLEEKQKVKNVIADWRSRTLWGSVLAVIQPIFLTPEIIPGLPEALTQVLFYMGTVMTSIGLIDAGKRGKWGNGKLLT